MEKKRVVITGMGAVTPLGNTREEFWRRLIAGESGVAKITAFDPVAAGLKAHIAAEVKDFNADDLIGRRDARRMDRYAQFAWVAAQEAIEDAKFPDDKELRDQTGVIVASGIGGIITIQDNVTKARALGTAGRITPFFIPMLMSNAAPAQISMRYHFRGPMYAVSSACASSNDAFSVAYDMVSSGRAPAMITGGSEATIIDCAMGGFDSMKALSTRNDEPERASRPFDAARDGFVLGEGGAIFVLEELELAKSRGARIYAELAGYGSSLNAYTLTDPSPDGSAEAQAISIALRQAELAPEDVDYIAAHGTSTPKNDPIETAAIKRAFGAHAKRLMVSSNKGQIGHTISAAGVCNLICAVKAIAEGHVPPTMHLRSPDPQCDLDYVPNQSRTAKVRAALANAFAFGGQNAVLAVRAWAG